jgi:hypothetical protein
MRPEVTTATRVAEFMLDEGSTQATAISYSVFRGKVSSTAGHYLSSTARQGVIKPEEEA